MMSVHARPYHAGPSLRYTIATVNPPAAARLEALGAVLRQDAVNRALAANALQISRTRYARELNEAKRKHARRPLVTLA